MDDLACSISSAHMIAQAEHNQEINKLKLEINKQRNDKNAQLSVLQQKLALQQMEIDEFRIREANLKKMNDTVMKTLNDLKIDEKGGMIFKEIQNTMEQHTNDLIQQKNKNSDLIIGLEKENRMLKDIIQDFELKQSKGQGQSQSYQGESKFEVKLGQEKMVEQLEKENKQLKEIINELKSQLRNQQMNQSMISNKSQQELHPQSEQIIQSQKIKIEDLRNQLLQQQKQIEFQQTQTNQYSQSEQIIQNQKIQIENLQQVQQQKQMSQNSQIEQIVQSQKIQIEDLRGQLVQQMHQQKQIELRLTQNQNQNNKHEDNRNEVMQQQKIEDLQQDITAQKYKFEQQLEEIENLNKHEVHFLKENHSYQIQELQEKIEYIESQSYKEKQDLLAQQNLEVSLIKSQIQDKDNESEFEELFQNNQLLQQKFQVLMEENESLVQQIESLSQQNTQVSEQNTQLYTDLQVQLQKVDQLMQQDPQQGSHNYFIKSNTNTNTNTNTNNPNIEPNTQREEYRIRAQQDNNLQFRLKSQHEKAEHQQKYNNFLNSRESQCRETRVLNNSNLNQAKQILCEQCRDLIPFNEYRLHQLNCKKNKSSQNNTIIMEQQASLEYLNQERDRVIEQIQEIDQQMNSYCTQQQYNQLQQQKYQLQLHLEQINRDIEQIGQLTFDDGKQQQQLKGEIKYLINKLLKAKGKLTDQRSSQIQQSNKNYTGKIISMENLNNSRNFDYSQFSIKGQYDFNQFE